MEPVNPITVTIRTAREISGLGNTTIWALIKSGKLESTTVGRRRLIVYRSLAKLLSPAPDPSPQPRRRGRPPKRKWANEVQGYRVPARKEADKLEGAAK